MEDAIITSLGKIGADSSLALVLAASFGILGVVLMFSWSRKTGIMAHCTTYCPMGLLANIFGKLNPWRIKIESGCNSCGVCSRFCRYDALKPSDLKRFHAGFTCSLCGDCITKCANSHLHYSFPGLSNNGARICFIVVITTLHAVFLGVARL